MIKTDEQSIKNQMMLSNGNQNRIWDNELLFCFSISACGETNKSAGYSVAFVFWLKRVFVELDKFRVNATEAENKR